MKTYKLKNEDVIVENKYFGVKLDKNSTQIEIKKALQKCPTLINFVLEIETKKDNKDGNTNTSTKRESKAKEIESERS